MMYPFFGNNSSRKLGARIVALVSLALLFSFSLVAGVLAIHQYQSQHAQLKEHGRLLGQYIAHISPEAILGFDFIHLNELVKEVHENDDDAHESHDIVYAVVTDKNGHPITTYFNPGHPYLAEIISDSSSTDLKDILIPLRKHGDVIHMIHPITHDGIKLGEVLIGVDTGIIAEKLKELFVLAAILGGIVTIMLGITIYTVFYRYVLNPVESLVDGADRVSRGVLDQPVVVTVDNELGWLGKAFNQMMSALSLERDKLHQANITLEQRVVERTKEKDNLISELQRALDEVETLRGIIPICSYCHNIRDDEGSWDRIEEYLSKHSDAQFSHGICPKCLLKARSDAGLDEK